jgi:DNA-binding NarL/FixJ family response regulator
MNKLRILIADDHGLVREGLKLLLDTQPDLEVVGEAENGQDVLLKAAQLAPDLVLMDLSMPRLNGLQAAQTLRRDHPAIKVLVITAYEDVRYFVELFQARGSGYGVKRTAGAGLLDAIRHIRQGGVYFDQMLAARALASLPNRSAHTHPARALPAHALSGREEEVMRGVAWGFTNKELANRLGLSVKTVETHKVRICEKLGLRSRAEMVEYAVRQGWMNQTREQLQ